jgi:hypothetical protein
MECAKVKFADYTQGSLHDKCLIEIIVVHPVHSLSQDTALFECEMRYYRAQKILRPDDWSARTSDDEGTQHMHISLQFE